MLPLAARLALAAPLAYILYFHGLDATGLLGPDEPRYADIGRAMARSGDWVTPRLFGEPWFEKPALLYWMTAAGFRLGLGPELAPRLPVATLGAAFLVFFYVLLKREFGARAAAYGAAILGTSAAWIGFSFAAVTDVPLAVTFSAAMLLSLEWLRDGNRRLLPWAGALFGLAVLAKGLVPLVLALPLAGMAWRRWRDSAAPVLIGLAVALPWYALCTYANGRAFLDEFFLRHHLGRFSTDDLKHVQPFWFYAPVLAGGLFPWTPLAGLLGRVNRHDPRERLLVWWIVFGLVFFSASTNKLPGYLMPLMPAVCALLGVSLDRARNAKWWLASCALLLALVPVVAEALPVALESGLSRAPLRYGHWGWAIPVVLVAAAAWRFERLGRRPYAVLALALGVTAGTALLKWRTLPALDAAVSARAWWKQVEPAVECLDNVHRGLRYGVYYYAGKTLPDCPEEAPPGERVNSASSPFSARPESSTSVP